MTVPRQLIKGSNAILATEDNMPINSVLVGVSWSNLHADIDMCALLCDEQKNVISDDHFLYWNQPDSLANDAFLRAIGPGQEAQPSDRAQCIVALSELDTRVHRIFISLSVLGDGQNLSSAGTVGLRIVDLASGDHIATYTNSAGYQTETCIVLAELYQYRPNHGTPVWKVRVVDQGYAGGLAALGADYGVNIA